MKQEFPTHLDIGSLNPIMWSKVDTRFRKSSKCAFFDYSKDKEDPPFKYLIVVYDQYEGFDKYLLVYYFDGNGKQITQTPFDSIEEVIRHGEFAFNINKRNWCIIDPQLQKIINKPN